METDTAWSNELVARQPMDVVYLIRTYLYLISRIGG